MALICTYMYLCLNAHTEKYIWEHTLFTYIYTSIYSIFQVRVLLTHGFSTSLLPPFLPLRVSFKRGHVRRTEGQFLANTCLYTFCVFYMSICSTCKWQGPHHIQKNIVAWMHTQKHVKIARKKRWLILDRNLIEFNFLRSSTSAFDRLFVLEHIELPAKLLRADYFLRSNASNINRAWNGLIWGTCLRFGAMGKTFGGAWNGLTWGKCLRFGAIRKITSPE